MRIVPVFLVATVLLLSGCTGIGPGTVVRDRIDYTEALSDSWKSQMLLNMVKVRYGDAPVFLDVASVITQYALETQASVAATWQSPLISNANTLGVGGSGKYTDRPTITYSPLTGERFARSLMMHIPVNSLLSLIQAGYPVDLVFRLCIHSINGIQNRFGGAARARQADPDFHPLLERMRRVQSSGAIGMKVRKTGKEESVIFVFLEKVDPGIKEDILAIRKVLGLDPQANELKVSYGSVSTSDKEMVILTRSILEILMDLASNIEVPENHVMEKRVAPTSLDTGGALIKIRSSLEKPPDAFVSLRYRGYWFWIDDKDLPSKGLFSSLMLLFTLIETGGKEGAPIVTISAGQ
jgi:hypothetical protein